MSLEAQIWSIQKNNVSIKIFEMQIYYCIPATTIFQDEAAYCLQDTFKLTKAILKCQLDIFDQIVSILAELQEQARQDTEEGGNVGEGI